MVALRGTETFTEWLDQPAFGSSPHFTAPSGSNVVDGFYRIYKTLTSTDPIVTWCGAVGSVRSHRRLGAAHGDRPQPGRGPGDAPGGARGMFVNAHVRPEVWTFGSPKVGDATFPPPYGYHATVSWRIYNRPRHRTTRSDRPRGPLPAREHRLPDQLGCPPRREPRVLPPPEELAPRAVGGATRVGCGRRLLISRISLLVAVGPRPGTSRRRYGTSHR